jgi:hypothetical protein
MREITTIRCVDAAKKTEGVAIVRAKKGCVAICLSAADDGDVEMSLSPQDVERLLEALKQGLSVAQSS